MGKKPKEEGLGASVTPAYLPPEPISTAEPATPSAPTPGFGSTQARTEPISLATDVTPAPSIDEPVWDGQHWTHSGRVWDGERWVASPELLADRRSQATERFQLSTVRLLKSLVYAVLSLVVLTAAIASLTLLTPREKEIAVVAGLSLAGLLALISLLYLWSRNRTRH